MPRIRIMNGVTTLIIMQSRDFLKVSIDQDDVGYLEHHKIALATASTNEFQPSFAFSNMEFSCNTCGCA